MGYSPWGPKESDMTEATGHAHTHTHNARIVTHHCLFPRCSFPYLEFSSLSHLLLISFLDYFPWVMYVSDTSEPAFFFKRE